MTIDFELCGSHLKLFLIWLNKSLSRSRHASSTVSPPFCNFVLLASLSSPRLERQTDRRANKHQRRGYHCLHGRKSCQTNSTRTLHVLSGSELNSEWSLDFGKSRSQINHSGSCRLRSVSFMFPLNPVIYAGQWRVFTAAEVFSSN